MAKVDLPKLDEKDYPSNSMSSKEEKKENKEKRKLQGSVKVKTESTDPPKPRFSFFKRQELKDAADYAVDKLIVPQAKDTAFAVLSAFLAAIIYQDAYVHPFRSDGIRAKTGGTPYHMMSRPSYETQTQTQVSTAKRPTTRNDRLGISNLEFDYKADADYVLEMLVGDLAHYGQVTVEALYSYIDQTGPFTAKDWGWMDLSSARVVPVNNKWLLLLPEAIDLG